MDEDKRLVEVSSLEGLDVGKSSVALIGKAMLRKSIVQFFVDGWGCVPSL